MSNSLIAITPTSSAVLLYLKRLPYLLLTPLIYLPHLIPLTMNINPRLHPHQAMQSSSMTSSASHPKCAGPLCKYVTLTYSGHPSTLPSRTTTCTKCDAHSTTLNLARTIERQILSRPDLQRLLHHPAHPDKPNPTPLATWITHTAIAFAHKRQTQANKAILTNATRLSLNTFIQHH